ncbi:interleukin-1 alpha [Trichosurus vulpecula]|uniref:interleukin-1 alpha n=1 Tax=Trichosurus vulpecula TaxID=9337 RepID=UPI00186B5442|nr:interleukin-1 alpha [Trichosurus vulpecula]
MARVPDMFEVLDSSYNENEGLISDLDQVSLSQESFYPSSSPHHKETKPENFEEIHRHFQGYMGVLAPQRKTENRRLFVSHSITYDNLLNVDSAPEEDEDVIRYKLASFTTAGKEMKYEFQSFETNQVLTDQNSRAILRKDNNLIALHIQGANRKQLFDIGRYVTLGPAPNNGIAVTIRLSNTNLYVTAKEELQAVELQEIPKTPTVIDGSQSPFLFYYTTDHPFSTFASVANPHLFLATTPVDGEKLIMAKGLPALIHFLVDNV